jgi:hypothetical protein
LDNEKIVEGKVSDSEGNEKNGNDKIYVKEEKGEENIKDGYEEIKNEV